jgi:hypothetical protein
VGGRWFSRRAVGLHLTLAVVVPAFALLFLWQVRRAIGGNELSWAYVFEWPFFGGYAIFLWWRLVHEQPGERDHSRHPEKAGVPRGAAAAPPEESADGGPAGQGPATGIPSIVAESRTTGPDADDPDAEEREAYNRYLAELDARGRRSRW